MPTSPRDEIHAINFVIRRSISDKLHKKPDSDTGSNDDDDQDSPLSGTAVPSTSHYQYSDLSGAKHIRLLRLQPGRDRDPIRCELYQTDLNTCNDRYDALSYVWGSQETLIRIQIGDAGLGIGPDLHHALTDLRKIDHPRLLWIDAICIDQSHVEERNVQVPLMREVYRNASRTICYLGPKVHKITRELYAMLEDLAREAKTLQPGQGTASHDAADTVPAFINHVPINPVQSELRDKYLGESTIVTMAGNRWWHRAWTVQELLLSRNAVMMTGRRTITWDDLRAAVDHGFNIQIWEPIHFGFILDNVIVPYLSIRAFENRQRFQLQLQLHDDSPARDLLHALMHCRHREATNPRDKIYAFLGLLRDAQAKAMVLGSPDKLSIEVNYDLPVVTIYRRVSQEFIQKLDNLDILGVCPKSSRRGLPSWVTDWSITGRLASPLTQNAMDGDRTTHATKGTKADCRFPPDGETVILSGYELTSVQQLADEFPFLRIDSYPIEPSTTKQTPSDETVTSETQDTILKLGDKHDWLGRIGAAADELLAASKGIYKDTKQFSDITVKSLKSLRVMYRTLSSSTFKPLFAWEKFATAPPPEVKDQVVPTRKQAEGPTSLYWQTLCAGTYKDGSTEKTEALFRDWSAGLQPVRELLEKHPDYCQDFPELVFATYYKASWRSYSGFWPYIACAQQRRLGWAANGWLCLLPVGTEAGDRIILARGGRVPLVIRPDGDGYHMFVGEAYIHGIMDGEVFEDGKCGDIKIC